MSGTVRSSADLDPRRRRILFRAWHRGTREMDLILGRFCDATLADLSDDDLGALEQLMEEADPEVYGWLAGEKPVPPAHDTPLFHRIRHFPLAASGGAA